MLDGINALISCFASFWVKIFEAPLYDSLTWGWFLVSVAVIDILITFLIAKLK